VGVLWWLRVRRVRRDPAQAWRLAVLAAAARLTSDALYRDPELGQVMLICLKLRTATWILVGGVDSDTELRRSGQAAHADMLTRSYLLAAGTPRVRYLASMSTVTFRDDGKVTSDSTGIPLPGMRGVLMRFGILPGIAGTDVMYAGEAELGQLTEQISRAVPYDSGQPGDAWE